MQKLCRYLDQHLDEPVRLSGLARTAGLSAFHVQRLFKGVLGISPRQYVRARRLLSLKSNLKRGDDVTSALYGAGFGSASRLYEHSTGELGMTPGVYRSGGAGTAIRYTVAQCRLGRMLVAATERGICAVRFGDSTTELVAELKREFSFADFREDGDALTPDVQRISRCLEGHEIDPDIPLDLRGTAFQAKVWAALRRIPSGETRSYAQVAASIRQPRAVRAVANACANNPVAVLVPCHRVVRADGALGGYRWGLQRKEKLLAAERSDVSTPAEERIS